MSHAPGAAVAYRDDVDGIHPDQLEGFFEGWSDVGGELVRRVLDVLRDHYMVDVVCDPDVVPFYQRLGMRPAVGASLRRFDRQSGRVR